MFVKHLLYGRHSIYGSYHFYKNQAQEVIKCKSYFKNSHTYSAIQTTLKNTIYATINDYSENYKLLLRKNTLKLFFLLGDFFYVLV